MRLPPRPEWWQHARCRGTGTGAFFPTGARSAMAARELCATCDAHTECLAYALDNPELVGIWAGTTEAERDQQRARTSA